VAEVAAIVIQRMKSKIVYNPWIFRIFLSISIVLSLLPLLFRYYYTSHEANGWDILFGVSSTSLLISYFMVDTHFLIGAMIDSSRRFGIGRILSSMARPSFIAINPILDVKIGLSTSRSVGKLANHQDSRRYSVVKIAAGAAQATSPHPASPDAVIPLHSAPRGTSEVGETSAAGTHRNSYSHRGSRRGSAFIERGSSDEEDVVTGDEENRRSRSRATTPVTLSSATTPSSNSFSPTKTALNPSPLSTQQSMLDHDHSIPRVDFSLQQNVYAWLYTRMAMMSYGHRMHFRVNIYIGTAFATAVQVRGLRLMSRTRLDRNFF